MQKYEPTVKEENEVQIKIEKLRKVPDMNRRGT
jgi:hypothetical protein